MREQVMLVVGHRTQKGDLVSSCLVRPPRFKRSTDTTASSMATVMRVRVRDMILLYGLLLPLLLQEKTQWD
jgi:hypothetical protein